MGETFADFFLKGKVSFCWGFGENWVVDVVFLWTECGGMRGKDGVRMCGFRWAKIMQFFWIYFLGRRGWAYRRDEGEGTEKGNREFA